MSQALSGASKIYLGNLNSKRDLTYVEDTARAFLLAARANGIEGQTIHFGQGSAVTIADLAAKCLQAVGSKAEIATVAGRQRPENSEVETLICNPAKAERLLGWHPETSLDGGLLRTAEYLRAHLAEYQTEEYVL
jgi:dTDP-glucose 4,6-dehydratase